MFLSIRLILVFAGVIVPITIQAATPSVMPVGTVAAAMQPVSRSAEFTGRVSAIESVNVRARVTGFLEAVLFKEGGIVNGGDKLFQIEAAPFEASVQEARGALLQAQGNYKNAAIQRERADELVKTSAASAAVRDQRVADEQNAQGAVVRADADLKTAEINLGYATITAPITGRIGRALVTKGNVVSSGSGDLTLIVSQDPMFILFPVSQREFLDLHGKQRTSADSVLVKVQFANGSAYGQTGRIDFVDVSVDRETDTVLVRAKVPNPDGILIPDQFVRVSVVDDTPREKIVIPQAALIADQEGIYVFVVENEKAVPKRVKLGPEVGAGVAVESGLAAGDQVIVTGTQSLRPGAPVSATPMRDPRQTKG
jgi:membrane fusion protein (multidrug efflux system)